MTTVVWDGSQILTDSQLTEDDSYKSSVQKSWRVVTPDGVVQVAACGEFHRVPRILRALADGDEVEPLVQENTNILVVSQTGARLYSDCKSWPITAPVFMGSGSAVARGAYHVTLDSNAAIKAAVAIDLYTGGAIRKLKTWQHLPL